MRTYLFASNRDPALEYRTTVHDNGAITCSCPARVECWHIRVVRSRPITGRVERTAVSFAEQDAIRALLSEGNDDGALHKALELFPSMSVEETKELLEEIEHDPLSMGGLHRVLDDDDER